MQHHADVTTVPAPDPAPAPGDILTRRLDQLRDEAWTRRLLESAIAEMTARGAHNAPRVTRCEIEYCKVKPGRDINAVLRVLLSGPAAGAPGALPGAGEEAWRRFSCSFWQDAELGRATFQEEEERRHVPRPLRWELAAQGFKRVAAFIPLPAVIVRLFPVDPALRGLAAATDPAQMEPVFARNRPPVDAGGGGSPRPAPRLLDYSVLHYKPARSCMIHYRVSEGSAVRRVYGKVYRDDRGEHAFNVLQAAWEASRASGSRWRSARPLAYVAPWRLLLQEAVPGREFRLSFADLTPDDASEAQLLEAEAHLRRIAGAIRSLQQHPAPPGPGPHNTFARLLAEQEKNLAYMRLSQPALAADLAGIREELARLEPRTAAAPLVFSHGDFAHGNVLIDGDRVGIIDFDKAGLAEPAYDVAYFLTHLWSFGVRHPRRRAHVLRLWQCFRRAYLDQAPEVSPARLALYEALDFSAYVLRNFRKQSHQTPWLSWARGQVEAARGRLIEAAGGTEGAPS